MATFMVFTVKVPIQDPDKLFPYDVERAEVYAQTLLDKLTESSGVIAQVIETALDTGAELHAVIERVSPAPPCAPGPF